MRVAVTGSAGYLGRALVSALAADDRIEEVVAIDRRPVPAPDPGVRQVSCDVRDPRLADDISGVDALIHLAFMVLGTGRDARSVNVDGSRNAFAAALGAGARAIVHASSAAVYGSAPDSALPLTEESPRRPLPRFYYPETKVEVERLLDALEADTPAVRVVRMRPVATLGPGAPALLRGRVFVTPAGFDPPMQFTWLDDVVAAFSAALHAPRARGAYNVGAPGPVAASKVAELIGARNVRVPFRALRALARGATLARAPGAMHPGWVEMARYPIVVDTARIERELGWRATLDCAGALRRYGELLRAPADARHESRIATEEA